MTLQEAQKRKVGKAPLSSVIQTVSPTRVSVERKEKLLRHLPSKKRGDSLVYFANKKNIPS